MNDKFMQIAAGVSHIHFYFLFKRTKITFLGIFFLFEKKFKGSYKKMTKEDLNPRC